MSDRLVISRMLGWHHTDIMHKGSSIVSGLKANYDTIYTTFKTAAGDYFLRRLTSRGEIRFEVPLCVNVNSATWIAADVNNNVIIAAVSCDRKVLEIVYVAQWGARMWTKRLELSEGGQWIRGNVTAHTNSMVSWSFCGTLAAFGHTFHNDSFVASFTPTGDLVYFQKIIGEVAGVEWTNNQLYLTGVTAEDQIFVQTLSDIGAPLTRMVPCEPFVDEVHDAAVVDCTIWISGVQNTENKRYVFLVRYAPAEGTVTTVVNYEVTEDMVLQTTVARVGELAILMLEAQDFESVIFFDGTPVHRITDQLVIGGPRLQIMEEMEDGIVFMKAGKFAGALEVDDVMYDFGREEDYVGIVMSLVTSRILPCVPLEVPMTE